MNLAVAGPMASSHVRFVLSIQHQIFIAQTQPRLTSFQLYNRNIEESLNDTCFADCSVMHT